MVQEFTNKGVRDLDNFNKEANEIMEEVSIQWDQEKDKYLTEMIEDSNVYEKWRLKINEDLESLAPLSKKRLLIKI